MENRDISESDSSDEDQPTLAPRNQLQEESTLPPGSLNQEPLTLGPIDSGATAAGDKQPEAETETLPQDISAGVTDDNRVKYFGDYELLAEIARGGMGVVYKARQTNLNRIVALKMILAGQFAGSEDIQRFYTEAEAAAQLDHPGIVPIYEIGEHQGQHYFSMSFIDGASLADQPGGQPLRPGQAADYVQKIATAIAYAHDKGVIHRDLKPANVLIAADGQPKVTDFGLAKRVESNSDLTRTGAVMGTPSYMPPEQASGNTDQVGPPADIYSLGAILYSLLTARPPFQAANPLDTVLQVLEKEPVSPRSLVAEIPKDLETVCLKCLQKSPGRRYRTAGDLANDLARFLRGEPVQARPVGRIERTWRWCKRKPAVAATIALASILLLVLAVGGPAVAFQQARLREEAIRDRKLAQRLQYASDMSLVQRDFEDGRLDAALRTLARYKYALPANDLRGFEWQYLSSLIDRASTTIQVGDPISVQNAIGSRDGRLVASAGLSGIHVWDAKSLQLIAQPKSKPAAGMLTFSNDSESLYWLDTQVNRFGALASWDLKQQKRSPDLIQMQDNLLLISPTFDSAQRRFAVISRRTELPEIKPGMNPKVLSDAILQGTPWKEIQVWDLADPSNFKLVGKKTEGTAAILGGPTTLAFHPTQDWLLVAGGNGPNMPADPESCVMQLYDLDSGEVIRRFVGHTGMVNDVQFSRDGKFIVSGGWDETARVWNSDSGEMIQSISSLDGPVIAVALDPSQSIIGMSAGSMIAIHDRASGKRQRVLRGHTSSINSINFVSDRNLVSGAYDGTVRIWDVNSQRSDDGAIQSDLLQGGRLRQGSFSWSLDVVLLVTQKRTAKLVKIDAQQEIFTSQSESENWQLAISPDASLLAVQEVDQNSSPVTKLIQADTGMVVGTFPIQINGFDSTGQRIFGRERDQIVIIEIASGEKISFQAGTSASATLSPDGQNFAVHSLGWNGSSREVFSVVDVYDLTSLEKLHSTQLDGVIRSSTFSDSMLAVSSDGEVRILDRYSGDVQVSFPVRDTVTGLQFHPDGKRLLTAEAGGSLRLWDVHSGREVLVLEHPDGIIAAGVTPDGNTLRALGMNGTIKSWSTK